MLLASDCACFYQQLTEIVSVSLWERSLPHSGFHSVNIPVVLSEEPNFVSSYQNASVELQRREGGARRGQMSVQT